MVRLAHPEHGPLAGDGATLRHGARADVEGHPFRAFALLVPHRGGAVTQVVRVDVRRGLAVQHEGVAGFLARGVLQGRVHPGGEREALRPVSGEADDDHLVG